MNVYWKYGNISCNGDTSTIGTPQILNSCLYNRYMLPGGWAVGDTQSPWSWSGRLWSFGWAQEGCIGSSASQEARIRGSRTAIFSTSYTQNFHMEVEDSIENDRFQKESSFPGGWCLGSILNFKGVFQGEFERQSPYVCWDRINLEDSWYQNHCLEILYMMWGVCACVCTHNIRILSSIINLHDMYIYIYYTYVVYSFLLHIQRYFKLPSS